MKKSKTQSLKLYCDKIWSDIIKIKAGNKSEISGRSDGALTAHHVHGKGSYALRYDIRNGICLDNAHEHIYGVHNKFNHSITSHFQMRINERMVMREGQEIFEKLDQLRWVHDSDLQLIKIYLTNELKKLKG